MPERLPPRGGPAPAPSAQVDLFARRAEPRVYSVTEITRELKAVVEGKFVGLLVKGEVSNLRQPSSGHLYFTLKDTEACIDAVLFRTEARRLRFALRAGLSVLVRGRLSVFEQQGRYQIICDSVEPLGAGALQVAFEQLKQKLIEEGIFDPARKRPLPFLPRRVALVTSPSGAVVHDFLRVLHRRFPNLPVLIVPARVQGDGAAAEIARAIARAGRARDIDVVVVARGGGSLEDLWAFNEEIVARALAACPVPTVSAVGHETDVTIADFAADVRAPTPTAAAELVARVKDELLADLAARKARLLRAWRALAERRRSALEARRARIADPRRLIGERKLKLDRLEQRLVQGVRSPIDDDKRAVALLAARLERAHPRAQLLRLGKHAAQLEERLLAAARKQLAQRHKRFEQLAGKLDALSPLKVLARGYAVVFGEGGHALRSAQEVSPGQALRVRLHDGELDAEVKSVRKGDPAQ